MKWRKISLDFRVISENLRVEFTLKFIFLELCILSQPTIVIIKSKDVNSETFFWDNTFGFDGRKFVRS